MYFLFVSSILSLSAQISVLSVQITEFQKYIFQKNSNLYNLTN